MKCPRCNSENPDNQKFCGNCSFEFQAQQPSHNQSPPPSYQYSGPSNNAPQKTPFYKKTWFIALMCTFVPPAGIAFSWIAKKPKNTAARIILTVFLALYSFVWLVGVVASTEEDGGENKQIIEEETGNKESERKKDDAKIKKEEPKENKEESEEVEEDNSENELTVGSSFEDSGLKITVNDASTDFQNYDNEYGWNTPEDGMKYVMVSFTFENNGDSDAYVSIYDFDCYADNSTCDQVYGLDDSDFINTNLSPGRNVSFNTYYSVPINVQSIELEYETNVWTGEKVIIKLQ